MDAVIVGEVPGFRKWLEERRALGQDRRDEVWDGVLHVVPPTSFRHQALEMDLFEVLRPIARQLGFDALAELGVFHEVAPGRENYRTPDIVVFDPRYTSKRGVERRAELVVEVLSPHDESRQKFGFYASCGIPEFWLVDPDSRVFEIHVLRDGSYQRELPRHDGSVHAPRLGLTLRIVDGPLLRIEWADGAAEI